MAFNFLGGFITLFILGLFSFEGIKCEDEIQGNYVKIYAGKFLQGAEREIFLENNKCFPLFGDWSSKIQSIKYDERTCVQLYEGSSCDGRSKILRGQFKTDHDQARNLANVNFDRKVHSIRPC